MREVSDEFLLNVAEVSATLIGLFLVGVFLGFLSVGALVLSVFDTAKYEPVARAVGEAEQREPEPPRPPPCRRRVIAVPGTGADARADQD